MFWKPVIFSFHFLLNDGQIGFYNCNRCEDVTRTFGDLRKLTGKKHPQIKLQRLQIVRTWAFIVDWYIKSTF